MSATRWTWRRTLFLGLASFASGALADPPQPEATSASQRSVERERLFWVCDYVATTRGVHLTPIDVCMEATDEIKRQKFGNDYQRFVAWWREHKPDEHRKLEIEERR